MSDMPWRKIEYVMPKRNLNYLLIENFQHMVLYSYLLSDCVISTINSVHGSRLILNLYEN